MDKIKKNFGFGCMRFPMIGEEIDEAQVSQMVDYFLDQGFNYFDTAHGYIGERSELAVKNCLTSRYPRESYILTNKLTAAYFEKEEDIRPFFESQLERCGVDYFDVYLMHAQGMGNYPKFKECHAYETALTFKEEGKIRHFGILANLPDDAKAVFEELHGGSPATYAIRYAAGFPGIMMVLSGMSSLEQMKENVSFMKDFRPLDEREMKAVEKVREILRGKNLIPCTGCRYCVDGCPKKISIPDLFACMNAKKIYQNTNSNVYYRIHTRNNGKASDCIKCGKCEKVCPQHLEIRKLLCDVADVFDVKA